MFTYFFVYADVDYIIIYQSRFVLYLKSGPGVNSNKCTMKRASYKMGK